jgi:catechol 2,3-dioxygenase-like lactoylglutathione lyase family enzyme
LLVSDIAASTAFWCDRLGFAIAYQRPERLFVYLERPEGAQLMLCQRSGNSLNGIQLLTNYAHICYFSQSFSETRAAEIGSSHADTLPAAGFFLPIYSEHPRLPAVLAAAVSLELQDFRGEAGLDS